MSSFVVEKKEYIKAAGLMHGIVSSQIHKNTYFLETVYELFTKAYYANVESWCQQYGEDYERLSREDSNRKMAYML